MLSFTDALDKIADGARHKVVVFELNAGNHAMKRALANALALQAIARDGRIPVVTSANCLQPDGQNDNGWNQGLLFLNPSQVWLQPPGYVTQMLSRDYQPQLARCTTAGAAAELSATAARSEDGKMLVLTVVNATDHTISAQISPAGFAPARSDARIGRLSAPLDAVNTAEHPRAVVPQDIKWRHNLTGSAARCDFPPHSLNVVRLE